MKLASDCPIIFITSPFLSRRKTLLLPASAYARCPAFAETDVIMLFPSYGPHSPISSPEVEKSSMDSVVDAKRVSPDTARAVITESVSVFHMPVRSSVSAITNESPPR